MVLLLCQHKELRAGSQTQRCALLVRSWPWSCLGLLAQDCDSSLSIPTIRDLRSGQGRAEKGLCSCGHPARGVRDSLGSGWQKRDVLSRGDPSLSSEKVGRRNRSSSSAQKMGFLLCHSGIIGMDSVACIRQVRPCHQLCLCPTQECGEFPASKERFLPSA